MKSLIASVSFCMLMLAAAPASADVVEFEAQAANRGGNLTGFPDSPLTIGIATFTGGEVRHGLINFPADETGVYASEGLFGSGETNQLVISFATHRDQPIDLPLVIDVDQELNERGVLLFRRVHQQDR